MCEQEPMNPMRLAGRTERTLIRRNGAPDKTRGALIYIHTNNHAHGTQKGITIEC